MGFISFNRMLFEFSLKLFNSIMCGNNFQIYGVFIPIKCIDLRHFYSCPSPLKTHPPRSFHHALGRRKLLIPSRRILSKICFPQQQKSAERTMIYFTKILSENMKMTWYIRLFIFCMICNFFKCDGFTILWIKSILYGINFIASPLRSC